MTDEIRAVGQCWVWATGLIGFGVECPAGAIPIMRGDVQQMRELVERTAELVYPSSGDMADVWAVPKVAGALTQSAAYEALQRYLLRASVACDTHKVTVVVNTASDRGVRRATARKLNGERH